MKLGVQTTRSTRPPPLNPDHMVYVLTVCTVLLRRKRSPEAVPKHVTYRGVVVHAEAPATVRARARTAGGVRGLTQYRMDHGRVVRRKQNFPDLGAMQMRESVLIRRNP